MVIKVLPFIQGVVALIQKQNFSLQFTFPSSAELVVLDGPLGLYFKNAVQCI